MSHAFTPPDICPVCGESVPRAARACPGCGADERSGWNEDAARYDGLDLPDGAFEDGARAPARGSPSRDRFWAVVVFTVLATLILTFIFR
jgi:hypothetical protein